MAKISDKVLKHIASAAEAAAMDSMGYASRGTAYEPKMPEELKAYKVKHPSKTEAFFDKITKLIQKYINDKQ